TRMPAARAAAALAPAKTKRRPSTVVRTTTATATTVTTATMTVFGIPKVFAIAKSANPGAADEVEAPFVICRTTPVRRAFTPSVATSGVTPTQVIATPLTTPDATQARTTSPTARRSRPSLPVGNRVTIRAGMV